MSVPLPSEFLVDRDGDHFDPVCAVDQEGSTDAASKSIVKLATEAPGMRQVAGFTVAVR